MKPIAVISNRRSYEYLCYHCNMPFRNAMFSHVCRAEHLFGMEFSGSITAGDAIYDLGIEMYERLQLIVQTRIR